MAKIEEPETPPWAQELLDGVQRLARVQGKLGLRVEGVEGKLEGGFADLRLGLDRLTTASSDGGSGQRVAAMADHVLDAVDLLCEVQRQPELPTGCAEGLAGVVARLDRALAIGGLTRHGELGQPVDGKRFRVVGTEATEEWPEGVVTRLVRHAAVRGSELVREGEVLINQTQTQTQTQTRREP